MKTPQNERDETMYQFELEWEEFSDAQKDNWEEFSETIEQEIPKSKEMLRKEIQDKITKFNENNL